MEDSGSALIVFGIISLLTLWIAGRRGFFRVASDERSPVGFWALVFGIVLYVLTVTVVDWLVSGAWLHVAAGVASTVVLVVYVQIVTKRAIWGKGPVGKAIAVGLLSWLVAYPVAMTVGLAADLLIHTPHVDQVAVREMRSLLGYPLLFWSTAATAIFLVPIAEEILFRGLIQGWLSRYIHPLWAILLSTILFAAAHYAPSQGLYNVVILAELVPLSLVLGHLYRRQRSLWAPISLHALFNGITLVILWTVDLFGHTV